MQSHQNVLMSENNLASSARKIYSKDQEQINGDLNNLNSTNSFGSL